MKLLKLAIEGNALYQNALFSIDLYASDRVIAPKDGTQLSNVTKLGKGGSVYAQNVIGISGVNASGKTTAISLLEFASYYLTMPYLMRSDRFAFEGIPAKMKTPFKLKAIFWHEGSFYLIDSTIEKHSDDELNWYQVSDEELFRYKETSATKKALSSFDYFRSKSALLIHRNARQGEPGALTKEQKTFLRDDMSIVSAITGNRVQRGRAARGRLEERTYSTALVHAFDSSVEFLRWDQDSEVYHLKFYGEDERSVSRSAAESQLSYGALIGSELVLRAIGVLRDGGLMIVDEIERGLNKALVRTIIELFLSRFTNPRGAQLIFTTHYPEILDFLPRKDDVYLLVRGADYKTSIIKYSDRVKRIENKKSEVVLSNFVKGTVPSYPEIKGLRTYVAESVRGTAGE